MNKLVKQQFLFVQSKNRSNGNTYDFTLDIPDQLIACEDDEILAITLLGFNFFHDFYIVNDDNNSFMLTKLSNATSKVVTLPNGNYPYSTLYKTINSLYGSNICTWDSVRNKLKFTFDDPHKLTFINGSYEILGFDIGEYTGTSIESVNVLNHSANISTICVQLGNVQPYKCYNLDNMYTKEANVSSLLMAIPVDAVPFGLFNYTNSGSEFKLFVHDKRLQQLRFTLTDCLGNPLKMLPDFTMSLKVETYIEEDEDVQLQTLQKILEYTRLDFISKHVKK
jgi:hypothetical protein